MNLFVQAITGLWFMVFSSLLIMAAAGATHLFNLYSSDIKATLGYDQTTTSLLSFFKNLGSHANVLSNLINKVKIFNLFGPLMIWLAMIRKISGVHVWYMCLFICIAASSKSFSHTSCLVTSINTDMLIDMLIIFLATICGIEGTLTTIDNMGQIGTSLRCPKRSISTSLLFMGTFNYISTIAVGFLSQRSLTKNKFPHPIMLTFILLFSFVGHLLIAFNVPKGLYFASIIIGFCFGAQWPLLFAIISGMFGLEFRATLYDFGSLASPIGSYLLNVCVVCHFYDRKANKQLAAQGPVRQSGQALNCIRTECYKLSFIIIAAATLFGAFMSLMLVFRTRKFFKSDINNNKFREAAQAAETEWQVRAAN
ncbi:hypothetical protein P3X46_025308 [Hevea brasiliensis]|uniref:Nodulin-like domain-containing protein n=1 Tax=Hevea brasiliensis TaxID=3981 RepID=A0ABQ9L6R1_HEVBR|nr:hypothetical protein P3X46_025308 [Hevea brasiliensis]